MKRPGPHRLAIGWIVTLLLVTTAALLSERLFPAAAGTDPWWRMWSIAFASWLGFKFLAVFPSQCRPRPAFLFWPGMDAAHFETTGPEPLPASTPALPILLAFLAGTGLLLIARTATSPITQGLLGMAALVALLHFGGFAVLANAWNRLGMAAVPLMREPWKADGLVDFWGARWNRGFSDIARFAVFRPLVRRFGPLAGTLAGFLLSGLAHEIVISLPARAGWGLPTLYFLIQGGGVLAERRWLGTAPGARRVLAWFLILAPAPLLFHPSFLERVIAPFIQATIQP